MSATHGTREGTVWRFRSGWAGHAPKEIARRRRRRKLARAARKRNR